MNTLKNIFTLVIVIIVFTSNSNAQTPYYYYYKGAKQYLNLDRSKVFLSVSDTNRLNLTTDSKSNFKNDISNTNNRQLRQDYKRRYYQKLTLGDKFTEIQYKSKIASIKQNNSSAVIAPYFTNQSGVEIGLSNFLYVKLKMLSDTTILKQQTNVYNAVIVCQDKFMPLWFALSVTEASNYNAMELANIFYESDMFQNVEPDLMSDDCLTFNPNDSYFNDQWGLSNTGQRYGGISGIDIKACSAWDISKGANIVVAVLDQGVDLNHPDLVGNIFPQSYDTESGSSPSQIHGVHGTACAGIIGARQNSIGITGVAPNCKIMSVSNSLGLTPLSRMNRGEGINWAVAHGARVISNSWSSIVQYQIIDDAINNAVAQGCVIIFSTGNNNGNVSYPANSNSNILTVGAISPCGQRKSPTSCDGETWGSNYGSSLDVVAPGVLIPTTDLQGNNGYNPNNPIHTNIGGNKITNDYSNRDYTVWFNGTSAACPHVAGVAALILSVNPNLTGQQVRDIIESTAQKVGGYNYQTTSGRPNGKWHQEMGYGLVDAYAALEKASLSGPKIIPCSSTVTYSIHSSLPVPTWTVSSNVQIVSGQGTRTLTVKGAAINSGTISGSVTASSSSYTLSKSISIAQPTYVAAVSGPTSVRTDNYVVYTASPIISSSEGTYEWVVSPSSGVTLSRNGYMCDVTFSQPGSYTVSCRTKNACISGGSYTMAYVNVTSGSSYSAAANSFNTVTVTYNPPPGGPSLSQSQSTLSKLALVDYKLTSLTTGTTVASGKMPSTGGTLDFSSIAAGIYVLHIDNGNGTPETFKIVLH